MFIVLKKKIIIAVAACILTIIAIPVAIHYTNNAAEAVQASTSANTNWGLSFPKDGGTPTGNASSEYILHLMQVMKTDILRQFWTL